MAGTDESKMTEVLEKCCADDQNARLTSLQLLEEVTFTLASPETSLDFFLHRAILKDGDSPMADTEVLSRILDSGANPAPKNLFGQTPLHLVAGQGHYSSSGVNELIQLFISKGADPNAKDDWGRTPLMHAAKAGYSAAVKELLANGADPALTDHEDHTAVYWMKLNPRVEIIDLFLTNDLATLDMSSIQWPSKSWDYINALASISASVSTYEVEGRSIESIEAQELKNQLIKLGKRIFRNGYPNGVNKDLSNLASWWNGQRFSSITSYDPQYGGLSPLVESSLSFTSPMWDTSLRYRKSETPSVSSWVGTPWSRMETPSSRMGTPSSRGVTEDPLYDELMLLDSMFDNLLEIPENEELNDNTVQHVSRGVNRPAGRAVGTHLEPKVAKAAHDMRKIVACWHCVLQRDRVTFFN